MTNNPANPDPGVTCVQVDGLTVVSIKPFSTMDAFFALIGGLIFIGIGFCMFFFNHAPLIFILPTLGCMFLFAVFVPAYTMFFTADVFVLSADSLEKRWSCKPFYRRSHIPCGEIQSIRADKSVVRTPKGGTRTETFLELTKTNGKTIRLINGGEMSRLRQAADYLNKALFPQYVPQPPPDQVDP